MRSDKIIAVVFVLIFLYGAWQVARWAAATVEGLPL